MSSHPEARPSSTVILARAAVNEPELLMVERHAASSFGGAWVFPGGVLERDDEKAARHCDTLDPGQANAILGLESGGLAYFSAAIRELFEETGLLLAEPQPGSPDSVRAKLLDGTTPWSELVVKHDIRLALARLHYISFWITPTTLPKRYSTRFFVAEAMTETSSSACGGEVLDCRWLTASDALKSADAGRMELHFPTRITLEALSHHASLPALLQWASRQAEEGVPRIFPELPEKKSVLDAVARGRTRQ